MAVDSKHVSEQLASALDAAPPYIQDFVRSGKFEAFMQAETAKHTLHLDTADKISNEILLTLLGFTSPDEMVDALLGMNDLDDDAVGPLLEEINESIFMPLRDSLRKNTPAGLESPKPVTAAMRPAAPSTPTQPLVPPITLVSPPQRPPDVFGVPRPTTVPTPTTVAARIEPPMVTPPVSTPVAGPAIPPSPPPIATQASPPPPVASPPPALPSMASPQTPVPPELRPDMHTMATDMQAIKENRVPEAMYVPPQQPAPAPIATPATPAPVLPATPLVPNASSTSIPANPSPPIPPPPPNLPGAPVVHEYGVDPYHEPIE